MGKNNIDLVWSIGELSGLFEKRTNMGEFLQDVVDRIADHMDADVCSIYLYDEDAHRLILRATRGLNADSVGEVELSVGEGITGRALKELRPIREARAKKNPHFKFFPELGEEPYESFLAVPIKRGLNRIGVMVLQHRRPDYFDVHDTRAIQAIASQLAATLENVEILMEIHAERQGAAAAEEQVVQTVHGKGVSEGLARGVAVTLGERTAQLSSVIHLHVDGEAGAQRFQEALSQTQRQLEELQREMEDNLSDVARLIFSSHLLMLKDEEFTGQMLRSIREGTPPEKAVVTVVNHYVDIFSKSKNARIAEKSQDVKDLGHRLLRNLSGGVDDEGDYSHQIVVAGELFPSELIKIYAQHAEGVVLMDGGMTAHISILARSLGFPVILVRDNRLLSLPEETELIIDTQHGVVYVSPDETVLAKYNEALALRRGEGEVDVPRQAYTADGVRVQIMANINIINDVRGAVAYHAEGIGLYRSEFPFLVRSDFPSEEEQYGIYRRVLNALGPEKETILRTLDIGGDKAMPQPGFEETNPFLGFRGIRFSLSNVEIFKEQLRAMLRAGVDSKLHIMFPMISSLDEFFAARDVVDSCLRELDAEGVLHNTEPSLGAMIELPSAVESAGALARAADFLSIGSNDLVMYLLGVDRGNDRVSGMYKHYHPAVLGAIRRITDAATEANCPLSICGDAASDPIMLPFFVGIGIRTLSVEPRNIPQMKRLVGALKTEEAEKLAEMLLACDTILEVEALLNLSETVETA